MELPRPPIAGSNPVAATIQKPHDSRAVFKCHTVVTNGMFQSYFLWVRVLAMSVKLSVVYDNPTDPEAFEKYYTDVHLPLVAKVPNIRRAETAKVIPKEDGPQRPPTA